LYPRQSSHADSRRWLCQGPLANVRCTAAIRRPVSGRDGIGTIQKQDNATCGTTVPTLSGTEMNPNSETASLPLPSPERPNLRGRSLASSILTSDLLARVVHLSDISSSLKHRPRTSLQRCLREGAACPHRRSRWRRPRRSSSGTSRRVGDGTDRPDRGSSLWR
jgi:hypothetical protein